MYNSKNECRPNIDINYQICISCNKSNTTIHVQIPKTPRVIIIDFLAYTKQKLNFAKKFVFDEVIVNPKSGKLYNLVATTNKPSASHYSCSIKDPCYNDHDNLIGWWNYDGPRIEPYQSS